MARDREYLELSSQTDLQSGAGRERVEHQPWAACLCAAFMPVIGVPVGLSLSMAAFRREMAAHLAESPGDYVCGLAVIPYAFLGLIGGSLGGIIAGMAIAKLITWWRARVQLPRCL